MVHTTEEDGKNSNFFQRLINLEVIDEALICHSSESGPNLRMFSSTMGVIGKTARIGQRVFDPSGSPQCRTVQIVAKIPIGPKEVIIDEVEVA